VQGSYALLPDPGGVPLGAYRDALVGMAMHRQAALPTPLLVVTVANDGRRDGWRVLLDQVRGDVGEAPPALVTVRGSLPSVGRGHTCRGHAVDRQPSQLRLPVPRPTGRVVGDAFRATGLPAGVRDRLGRLALPLAPCDRCLLEVV